MSLALRGISRAVAELEAEVTQPRYEYKIVETRETGVPMAGDMMLPHQDRLVLGLNELGAEGWLLVSVVGSTMMIFARRLVDDT